MDGFYADRVQRLIYPLTLNEFLAQYWPTTFHHFSGDPERLASLLSQPELQNVASLVRCQNSRIRAVYTRVQKPYDSITAESVQPYEFDITAERAVQLYESGCTITVNTLVTEEIRRWNAELDSALGLLPGTATMNAFASTPGKGVAWHWDSQELFIVQVYGRKLWRVAPNEDVVWPSENGWPGVERRSNVRHELLDPNKPIEVPRRWSECELCPGSVLFLPRGYWHAVDNVEESLHLVLQLKLPSWRDIFLFILRQQPELRSMAWRQPTSALRPEQLTHDGVREFATRCADLAALASPETFSNIVRRYGEQSPSIILGDS